MAKAFELNTMKVWRLTARIAGIESTAKITSLVSITTSTANSGVATRLAFSLVNRDCPWYSAVEGTTRRTRPSTGLFSGWISASSCCSRRYAVKTRKPPNTKSIHSNRFSRPTPAKMNAKRSTSAPNTPQNSTRNW